MFRTALFSALLTSTSFANPWYVDDDGKADFDNIQAAVDAASDGDMIFVYPGMYTSTADEVVNMLGKAVTLRSLYPNNPDVVATTIIDGEDTRRGILCISGETNKTIIEGLTIANCYDTWGGGGIYNDFSSPTLENCTFTGNTADQGGGMYNYYSNSTLIGCTFTNNTAVLTGGGIHIEASQPTITNGIFTNNECPEGFGGGICVVDGILSLQDCEFVGNVGGIGGGVYNQPDYGTFHEVHGCTFKNNQAVNEDYGHGGGLNHGRGYLNISNSIFINNSATGGGGGISEFASDGMLVRLCDFSSNFAQGGAGIDTGGIGGCTVISSKFSENHSISYGGGIQSSSPNLYMINCRLTNNVADWLGGAVLVLYADQQPAMFVNCIMDNNTTYAGATVSIHGTLATKFINTTIMNNTGPGLYLEGWEGQQVQVLNSIVWGNSPIPISVNGDLDVDVRFSDIEGGWEGEGNINADPQIIFNQDAIMIHASSSCIDIANNELLPSDVLDLDADGDTSEPLPVDFYGEARVEGVAVDMGSLEYFAADCLGDINGDAIVNVVDILEVISEWGSTNSPADINTDGIVDVTDLLIVVGNWGPCV